MKGCIMFTDIKQSSMLWRKSPTSMFNALLKHNDLIESSIQKFKGMVVKSIGDSYMAYFKDTRSAVKCAIFIQNQDTLQVGNAILKIRIGIACGKLYQKNIFIQNCNLKDFFGHTVNVAARLEANVSPVGGIALCIIGKNKLPKEIERSILNKKFKIKPVEFKSVCKKKFSNHPLLGNECRLDSEIKGVGELQAFILYPTT